MRSSPPLTFDAVAGYLATWRWVPELRFLSQYHDDPGYVGALAASLREAWASQGEPDRQLFSFHGLPRRYLEAGDPYHCACQKTARLVAEALGLPRERWALSFQSRVGREEWLRPYTDELLKQWGAEGVQRVHVACPGFSADCLETLEEIGQEALRFRLDRTRTAARSLCRSVCSSWRAARKRTGTRPSCRP